MTEPARPQPFFTPRVPRRSLLLGGAAGGLAALGGGFAVGSEAYAATTPAKGLGPGGSILPPETRPNPALPAGTDTIPQIEHIVVLMMENHSFDDHLGMLGRGDGLTLGANGLPVNYNPDPAGGFVSSFHNPNTCGETDSHISQGWNTSHICWDNGTNMGFVKGCSGAAMGYWTGEDLPFYYSMAGQFPIGDRYFSSVMAQTYPNRRFLIAGSAYGNVSTNASGVSATDAPNGTVFDRLNQYGISWKDYYPDIPTAALFLPNFAGNGSHMAGMQQFFTDAAAGTLPSFCLVEPYTQYSEEDNDITIGEAFASLVVNAVMASPNWSTTMLVWIYDEYGGWYDHVPPVPAVKPDNIAPEIQSSDFQAAYDYTGFRVPCCVVSPFAKKDYVSHVVYDHTSVLKLVETKWNLPALTFRDANANNMLDFLDLTGATPAFAEPPRLAAPRNPFNGPASLPAGSLKNENDPGFHQICAKLPAGSLPPVANKLAAKPPNADSLLAAHLQRFVSPAGTPATPAKTTGSSSGPIIAGVAGAAALVAGGVALALRARRRKPDGNSDEAGGGEDEPEVSSGDQPD